MYSGAFGLFSRMNGIMLEVRKQAARCGPCCLLAKAISHQGFTQYLAFTLAISYFTLHLVGH